MYLSTDLPIYRVTGLLWRKLQPKNAGILTVMGLDWGGLGLPAESRRDLGGNLFQHLNCLC